MCFIEICLGWTFWNYSTFHNLVALQKPRLWVDNSSGEKAGPPEGLWTTSNFLIWRQDLRSNRFVWWSQRFFWGKFLCVCWILSPSARLRLDCPPLDRWGWSSVTGSQEPWWTGRQSQRWSSCRSLLKCWKRKWKIYWSGKKHKNILRGGSVATVPFASADFCVVLFQNCWVARPVHIISLYDDDTNIIMKMFWWSPPTCPWNPGSIHSCGSPSRLLSLNDKKVSLTFFTFMYLCFNKIIACSMCARSYLKLCGDYLFVWSIFKAGVKALWCTYIWFTIYSYIAI